jgi:hypothetical protein
VLFRAGQAKPARWWLVRALGLRLSRFHSLDSFFQRLLDQLTLASFSPLVHWGAVV